MCVRVRPMDLNRFAVSVDEFSGALFGTPRIIENCKYLSKHSTRRGSHDGFENRLDNCCGVFQVQQECEGLQYQVEVRNITQRIGSLSEKLDSASMLGEPRENAFLTCDFGHNDSTAAIEQALPRLGKVRTSTTFPSLCTASLATEKIIAGLETTIVLRTVDYHGDLRSTGGDPISADVHTESNQNQPLPCRVADMDDGTYEVHFRPPASGRYVIKLAVFERPIKDCPLFFDVTEHNNPVATYGSRGSGKDEFLQPVAIAVDDDQTVYVVDTGNSRIKVLSPELEFVRHVTNDGLNGRSCTGIAISGNGLVIINWRTKRVVEMTTDGETVNSFTYNAFQEPIDVAVDKSYGHILVADNGLGCICVFDSEGKILFQVRSRGWRGKIERAARRRWGTFCPVKFFRTVRGCGGKK